MLKPENVAYVYPMNDRIEIEVPAYLEHDEGLVIFNVEAGRSDDLMNTND